MRLLTLTCLMLACGTTLRAEEYSYDFRGSKLDESTFRVVGAKEDLHWEAGGLRIAKTGGDAGNSGVALRLQVVGDCAVEAPIEFLDVPTPTAGYGTGVTILLEDGTANGASLQRIVGRDGRHTFVAHKYVRSEAGEYQHDAKSFPAAGTRATLRMERTGDEVVYKIAEGGEELREIHRAPFTSNPLKVVQIYGQTGGEPNRLSVRVDGLKMRIGEATRPGQAPREQPADNLPLIIGAVVAALALIALIAVMVRRSRRADAAT